MPMIGRYQAVGTYGNRAEFTSSGNWTVPAGVTRVRARLVGGGGGSYNNGYQGSNGYFREVELTVTPGASMPVVIGAGGAAGVSSSAGGQTTFGGIAADGGYPGLNASSQNQPGGAGWGIYGKGGLNGGAGGAGFVEIAY